MNSTDGISPQRISNSENRNPSSADTQKQKAKSILKKTKTVVEEKHHLTPKPGYVSGADVDKYPSLGQRTAVKPKVAGKITSPRKAKMQKAKENARKNPSSRPNILRDQLREIKVDIRKIWEHKNSPFKNDEKGRDQLKNYDTLKQALLHENIAEIYHELQQLDALSTVPFARTFMERYEFIMDLKDALRSEGSAEVSEALFTDVSTEPGTREDPSDTAVLIEKLDKFYQFLSQFDDLSDGVMTLTKHGKMNKFIDLLTDIQESLNNIKKDLQQTSFKFASVDVNTDHILKDINAILSILNPSEKKPLDVIKEWKLKTSYFYKVRRDGVKSSKAEAQFLEEFDKDPTPYQAEFYETVMDPMLESLKHDVNNLMRFIRLSSVEHSSEEHALATIFDDPDTVKATLENELKKQSIDIDDDILDKVIQRNFGTLLQKVSLRSYSVSYALEKLVAIYKGELAMSKVDTSHKKSTRTKFNPEVKTLQKAPEIKKDESEA